MTLVGSSPPPHGPDDGSEEAASPNGGDRDATFHGDSDSDEEDSGWVAPGAPTGPGPGTSPRPGPPPGEPSPWQGPGQPPQPDERPAWSGWQSPPPGGAQTPPAGGWQSPPPGEGQAPPGEPSAWQGWQPPAPGGGEPGVGWGQPRESGGRPGPDQAGSGPAQGWSPPPQPAWSGAGGWGTPGYEPPVSLPKAYNARTGPLPLHPMSFGDVLDGAFRLLKANLATIVLVTAVFFVPLELISAFFTRHLSGGPGLLQVLRDTSLAEQGVGEGLSPIERGGIAGTALLGLLITPFVGGAITQVVAASYLGRQLSVGDAIRTTGRRVWALLGAAILVHLIELVGLVLCLLPALVAMAFLICTTPAVMIEELGPIKSMRRSFTLVRPRFWPVLGIALVSGILAILLRNVLGTPFTLAARLVGLQWGFILLAIGSIVPILVASPFVWIVATLVYFDARIRHEGFDLQMIARGLADGDAPAQ